MYTGQSTLVYIGDELTNVIGTSVISDGYELTNNAPNKCMLNMSDSSTVTLLLSISQIFSIGGSRLNVNRTG